MNKEYNLQPIWDKVLDIYEIVQGICDKHGLRVYGIYGTALGAVRHKGFIPWDDDFDVGMPRPDFNKFIELSKQELPPWLTVLTWKNSPTYNNLFAKVIVTDKAMVDKIAEESGMPMPMGVCIDVFPYDGFPTTKIGVLWRLYKRALYNAYGYAVGRCWSEIDKPDAKLGWLVIKMFGWMLKLPHNQKEVLALHEREITKMPYEGAKRISSSMWYKKDLRLYKRDLPNMHGSDGFGAGQMVPFQGRQIRIPLNVNAHLRVAYCDYMKLPPESERYPDHTCENIPAAPWRFGPEMENYSAL